MKVLSGGTDQLSDRTDTFSILIPGRFEMTEGLKAEIIELIQLYLQFTPKDIVIKAERSSLGDNKTAVLIGFNIPSISRTAVLVGKLRDLAEDIRPAITLYVNGSYNE